MGIHSYSNHTLSNPKLIKMKKLFKLLSKKLPTVIVSKSNNEIIDQIHEDFFTEVNNILTDAGIKVSIPEINTTLSNKSSRLHKLGFNSTKEIKELETKNQELINAREANKNNEKLTKMVKYFSQKYPLYKFITEDSIKRICKKYGLIYSNVENYIGDVPDNNLAEIERAIVQKEDKIYLLSYNLNSHSNGFIGRECSYQEYRQDNVRKKEEQDRQNRLFEEARKSKDACEIHALNSHYFKFNHNEITRSYKEAPMIIAANVKDFDTSNMEINFNSLSIPGSLFNAISLSCFPVFINSLISY